MNFKNLIIAVALMLTFGISCTYSIECDLYPNLPWETKYGSFRYKCNGMPPLPENICEAEFKYSRRKIESPIGSGKYKYHVSIDYIDINENCPCKADLEKATIKAIYSLPEMMKWLNVPKLDEFVPIPNSPYYEPYNPPIIEFFTASCFQYYYYTSPKPGGGTMARFQGCPGSDCCMRQYNVDYGVGLCYGEACSVQLSNISSSTVISTGQGCPFPCESWCDKFCILASDYLDVFDVYDLVVPTFIGLLSQPKVSFSKSSNDILITPNPSSSMNCKITINNLNKGDLQLIILGYDGKEYQKMEYNKENDQLELNVELNGFYSGVYYFRFLINGQIIDDIPFVVE